MVELETVPGSHPEAMALVDEMVAALDALYADRPGPRQPTTPGELSPPDGAFVLVREDGRAVAGGGVRRLAPGLGEIKRMYVRPEARSRGHARRLLGGLEAAAAELGFWRVRLDTGPEQPHARALYESAGYRTIEDYNDNPLAAYWGEKDLPAVVPARFNGPPSSGHGGYSAWLAARYLDTPAIEVRLKAPPPLEEPMDVAREDGRVELRIPRVRTNGAQGAQTADSVLVAAPGSLDGAETPPALGVDAAHAARVPERWASDVHPFPTCFACGPLRDDGLRLFPGPLDNGDWATDWTPPPGCGPELVWAALDCPSGAPFIEGRETPIVLASFTVEIRSLPDGAPHAIVTRPVSVDGRKHTSVVALYSADGELRALARALWIALR